MRIVSLAALSCALVFHAVNAFAQSFPAKAMTIVVPLGPGGGYDYTGRLLEAAVTPSTIRCSMRSRKLCDLTNAGRIHFSTPS